MPDSAALRRTSGVARAPLVCGLALALLCVPWGAGAQDEPARDGLSDGAESVQQATPIQWRERFFTEVPAGWTVARDDFDADSAASPDAVRSHAVLMRSPAGTHVLVSFIDGGPIRLALATQSLEQLMTAWTDGYHLVLGHPVGRTEPWACRLDLPVMGLSTGRRLYTRKLGPLPDPDERSRSMPSEGGPLWMCGGRLTKSGELVIVQGWWLESSSPDEAGIARHVSEIEQVVVRTGFTEVRDAASSPVEGASE